MEIDQRIAYSVAFKGVIALVCAGEVEFETSDVVAETIELTDAFYEAIATKTGLDEDTGKSTSKRSGSSKKRASKSGGSTKKSSGGAKPKDPDAPATKPQIGFLKKLIRENPNNAESDSDGCEVDGEWYDWDDFTMGTIQEPIEFLKDL